MRKALALAVPVSIALLLVLGAAPPIPQGGGPPQTTVSNARILRVQAVNDEGDHAVIYTIDNGLSRVAAGAPNRLVLQDFALLFQSGNEGNLVNLVVTPANGLITGVSSADPSVTEL